MAVTPRKPVEIFYSYTQQDEQLHEALETQLSNLKRQGLIAGWHDRMITPGTNRQSEVNKYLNTASIILLLVSPNFIASDYCYSVEMKRALERHDAKDACVIPIILRPTDWKGTPFEQLKVLPTNGKPVTNWRNRDKAFLDIAQGIREVVEQLSTFKDEDALLQRRQEYCDTVYERWKMLDFKGIMHFEMNRPMSMPLSEVFVLPDVWVGIPEYETIERFDIYKKDDFQEIERRNEIEDSRRDLSNQEHIQRPGKKANLQREKLQSILSGHRRLVILGDPGSGKSTLLRYMTLLLAQNYGRFNALFAQMLDDKLTVPLYIPLVAYAEAWRSSVPGERSLKSFLFKYLCDNYLDPFHDFIHSQFEQGRVLLLLDGLDEIPDASLRTQIVQQIEIFTLSYSDNHFIVTSRIIGYKEAPLAVGYEAYTLADFNEEQINTFTQQWCPAYERWVKGTTDNPYLQSLATIEAEKIFHAIKRNPPVQKLAVNPLLLTILALIQRQGIELPSHRIELFDLCAMTLLDTWVKAKGTAHATHFTKNDLIKILRPLAFWMHEHPAFGAIPEEELVSQIVKQLLERKITRHEDEAAKLAEEFLQKVRGETGVLVEKGRRRYGFLHQTFEEYFAARELEIREDKKDFIKAHIHDPRWREVILLTIGAVGILQSNEKGVTELVRDAVLHAESPFEHWLHRDLLFAGICLADDIGVSIAFEEEIIEKITYLYLTSPYDSLRDAISPALNLWRGTALAAKSITILLPILYEWGQEVASPIHSSSPEALYIKKALVVFQQYILQYYQDSKIRLLRLRIGISIQYMLQDADEWLSYVLDSVSDPDWHVRQTAAKALGQLGSSRPEVISSLLKLSSDSDLDVRLAAVQALGEQSTNPPEVITSLFERLSDTNASVRKVTVIALGQIGSGQSEVVEILFNFLADYNSGVRKAAAEVLGQLGNERPEIIGKLLKLLTNANPNVKEAVVNALGQLSNKHPEIIETLLKLSDDAKPEVRKVAVKALGQFGGERPEIVDALLKLLFDRVSDVKEAAAKALGKFSNERPEIVDTLLKLLSDVDSDLKQTIMEALSQTDRGRPEVIESLLKLSSDSSALVRRMAAEALGQLGEKRFDVVETLRRLLYDGNLWVKFFAAEALGQLGEKRSEVVEVLLKFSSDSNALLRLAAVTALGQLGERQPKVIEVLIRLSSDADSNVRKAAATALGQIGERQPEVIEVLIRLSSDADSDVRKAAATALGQIDEGQPEVIEVLIRLLADTNTAVREASTDTLAQMSNGKPEMIKRISAYASEAFTPDLLTKIDVKDFDEYKQQLSEAITVRLLELVKNITVNSEPLLVDVLLQHIHSSNSDIRLAAVEALGQLKDERVKIVDILLDLLADPHHEVRRTAIETLGRLGRELPIVADSLLKSLFDYRFNVKQATVEALRQLDDKRLHIFDALFRSFAENYGITSNAYQQLIQMKIEALGLLGSGRPEIIENLLKLISDPSTDWQLLQSATIILGRLSSGQPEIIECLLNLANSSNWLKKQAAAAALGQLRDMQPKIESALLKLIFDDVSEVKQAAAEALGRLGGEHYEVSYPLLILLLSDSSIRTRQAAASALGALGNGQPEVLEGLCKLLTDPNIDVRQTAASALGALGNGQPEVLEGLCKLLFDPSSNSSIKGTAAEALSRLGNGQPEVINVLLRVANDLSTSSLKTALSYALASPQLDRHSIGKKIERDLYNYEAITSRQWDANIHVDELLFALQQVVGEIS